MNKQRSHQKTGEKIATFFLENVGDFISITLLVDFKAL